jgi:hypothetical protein
MRIVIETDGAVATQPTVVSVPVSAAPAAIDAGAAPAELVAALGAVAAAPTSPVLTQATDAGGPPAFLIGQPGALARSGRNV